VKSNHVGDLIVLGIGGGTKSPENLKKPISSENVGIQEH